jgi:dCMP deaminase
MTPVDRFYLALAYVYASRSPDPSTQNGAVIVPAKGDEEVCDCNNFPTTVSVTAERLERPLKYQYIEHAERNVVYKAARLGIKTEGATMYCPWYACTDCARAIIQAGIVRVVGHALPEHENNPRWKESIAVAVDMLKEAGVQCDFLEGKLDAQPIRMNGVVVYP